MFKALLYTVAVFFDRVWYEFKEGRADRVSQAVRNRYL